MSKQPSRFPLVLIVVAALGLGAVLLTRWLGTDDVHALTGNPQTVSPAGGSPAEFGVFPDFELVSQEGKVIRKADLLGRPFFACAVFTNCTGPCPGITAQMKALQEELKDLDVLLVTVTVDPEHDTSEVLGNYASKYDADPERWLFLTGPEKDVDSLVRNAFFLAVDRAGKEITHDTRIIAVDAEGRRRGWYDGTDRKAVQRLRGRMTALAAEAR